MDMGLHSRLFGLLAFWHIHLKLAVIDFFLFGLEWIQTRVRFIVHDMVIEIELLSTLDLTNDFVIFKFL